MLVQSVLTALLAALALAPPFVESTLTVPDREELVEGAEGKELDAYLERCELFGFSGSVLVAREGRVVLRKGYGEARPGEGVRNSPETLYDIASASKQITAAAILKLESLGTLSTEDSIAKHLADVPKEHEEVTIQHLLNHTAGFPRSGPSGGGPDLDTAMAGYLRAKRARAAGRQHEYYNGGYAMLAAIVERASGEAFETWVDENLFAPAGMEHTYFIDSVAEADEPRLARTHDGGKLTNDYLSGWAYRGMGGVVTSVSDLHLWMQALFGGEILPEKSLAKLLEPALENYACGWYVLDRPKGRRVVSHGGTAPGFQSYIRYFVEDDVMVLLMSNREGMHWQVTWGLSAMLVDEDAKSPPPPQTVRWGDDQLDELVGRYTSKKSGDLVVRREGGALHIGAEGQAAIALLSGEKPAKKAEFKAERELAAEIVEALLAGDAGPIESSLASGIPKSWPNMILTSFLPKHVDKHGEILSSREIGARFDAESKRVHVWVRLHHPEVDTTVEIGFEGDKLRMLDMKAPRFPAELAFAPVGKKELAAFDFSDRTLPTLSLATKSRGPAALELKLGSKGYRFERDQED